MNDSSVADQVPDPYPADVKYAQRYVAVDSAALYTAVNAYVETIVAGKMATERHDLAEVNNCIRALDRAQDDFVDAAYAVALNRYEQRRAAERERQS